jgi:hypothetical protein
MVLCNNSNVVFAITAQKRMRNMKRVTAPSAVAQKLWRAGEFSVEI